MHKYRPDAIVMYNAGGTPEDAIDDSDANCAEGLAPAHSYQSFSCRWAKSHGKPYEIITSSGLPNSVQSSWSAPQPVFFDHWTQKPAELLQLETSIAAAHGGNATIGLMPFANGTIEQGQLPALRAAFDRIRRLEPYLKGIETMPDVGLVLTTEPYRAPHRWAGMMEGALQLHEALLQGHFQFEVVEGQGVEDYCRYQVVILADQLTMSQREVQRVRDYVAEGGHLVVMGASSLYDEQGHALEDFALSDVMGVHYEGKIEDRFGYLRIRDADLAKGIPDVPILVNRAPLRLAVEQDEVLAWVARPEALRTEATAMIWGNPAPDDTETYPAVVRHQFGRGCCCTIGVSLETTGPVGTWTRQMAINLVDSTLDHKSLVTDAPPGVEVVWNRQDQRSILHLINHQAGDPDRLSTEQNKLVLRGITVRLARNNLSACTRIRSLDDSVSEVAHRSTEDWLEIEIPPFVVHTALIIE